MTDDAGYLQWRSAFPHGYVINIHRSHSPIDAHLHDVDCGTLVAQIGRGVQLTSDYVEG